MATAPTGYLATIYLVKSKPKTEVEIGQKGPQNRCKKAQKGHKTDVRSGKNVTRAGTSTHPVAGLSALGMQQDSRQHSPDVQ